MIRELLDTEVEAVAGGFTINGNGNNPVNINFQPQNVTFGGNATGGNGNGNVTAGNAGGQTFGPISF